MDSSYTAYPSEWMDVQWAVAVDFGRGQDPLAPVWIHFHAIEGSKNAGTKDFDKVHAIHEQLGFGSMITQSYQEYQFLVNAVELPVTFVDEKHLPKLVSKEVCFANKHPWIMKEEDDFNSNWNEAASNAYYRSYRLARQMEHLRNKVLRNKVSVYDMNHDKTEEQRQICKLFENMQFKLSVS